MKKSPIMTFATSVITAFVSLRWAYFLETSGYVRDHGGFVCVLLISIGIIGAIVALSIPLRKLSTLTLAFLSPFLSMFILVLLSFFFEDVRQNTPEEYIVVDQDGERWKDSRKILWQWEYDQLLVAKKHRALTCDARTKNGGVYQYFGKLSLEQNVEFETLQEYRMLKEKYMGLETLCQKMVQDFYIAHEQRVVSLKSRNDITDIEKDWIGFNLAKPWFDQRIQEYGIRHIVRYDYFQING